ncbi:RHS repeat-associated core domain-containing protein [Treponema pedis]|nr:RHS repeat-associated core domain-containing protein [Treponema pedis]QSI04891.1 RHS repeat-associated core domain-containing protein [Treponema pedis]
MKVVVRCLLKEPNYLFRTAIAREQKQFTKIAFAVHLSAVIPAERYRSDSGALKSAVLNFIFFMIIINKMQQSAAQSCLGKKLSLSEILTDRAFENRRSRYKELGKKVPQAYRVYVEDTFLPYDAVIARIFSKEETGLYYYGARYLDPKYSRWLSGDPALNDYIPKAPIDDDAKKHNENLPGMGGVYNTINLHVYHYAGNNPIKYTDPDGRDIHITITNKKVGTGYLRTTDDNGKNIIVKVPTYRMTVYDDATGKTLNYEVTRHSVLDANDSNISEPKDFATYEPKGKSSFFKGFISRKNYGFAIELRNYKNPSLRGDLFRSDTGEANDKTIEIHVGGNYVGLDGVEYNVTSWGCFSLQGEYVNGDGYEKFINDICNKLDYKQNKHIIIEVQKIE